MGWIILFIVVMGIIHYFSDNDKGSGGGHSSGSDVIMFASLGIMGD